MTLNFRLRLRSGLRPELTKPRTFRDRSERANDEAIWEHARDENAVLITKDEDFADRWLLSDRPVPLIWIRKGNCSTRALIAWLEPLWPDVLRRLEQGEQFIELRS